MLMEHNVIPPGELNALTDLLGIVPTPLDEGLRRLANSQPEQLPDEGVGSLVRRLFYAPLHGVTRSPSDLFTEFRWRFVTLAPEATMGPAAEPVSEPWIEPGATLTLSLPLRGNVQVRVVELTGTSLTLVTVSGHPLAGSVTFRFLGEPGVDLRFEVEAVERAATLPDALSMASIGQLLQGWNWSTLVERTATALGAPPPIDVRTDVQTLTDEEARLIHENLQRKVDALARAGEPDLREEARERVEGAVAVGSPIMRS
jgi:NADH dehydrogenase